MSDQARATLEYIPLDRLTFDPENPRFPTDQYGASEEAALTWLLGSANLTDLMASIAQQGFSPGEPLLVVAREGDEGRYVVVEGNRRYAATLLLNYPERAPLRERTVAALAREAQFTPQELPCLIFRSSDEILGFLGYRHITGIQEWSPLAKARYLRRLWQATDSRESTAQRLKAAARRIGSRSDYVARLLTALALYETLEQSSFFADSEVDEDRLPFSLLVLALNRATIPPFLGLATGQDFSLKDLNQRNLEDLGRWLFVTDATGRTVLGESRNIGVLAEVLADEEATAVLRRTSSLAHAAGKTGASAAPVRELVDKINTILDEIAIVIASGDADEADASQFAALRTRVREMQRELEDALEDA